MVTISRGFWMEKFLVTQGDYLAVVGSNPSYFNRVRNETDYGTDLTRPVEEVSWIDATNYCALRTQQERAGGLIPTNYVYRLPTESEWEYACRAGTTTAFYLGSDLRSGQANFNGHHEYDAAVGEIENPNGIYLGTTTPVGSYAANGWGLYDMIGNVWEWCQDWSDAYPAGSVTDPQGAVTGSFRAVRGGGWNYFAKYCRSADRYDFNPGVAYQAAKHAAHRAGVVVLYENGLDAQLAKPSRMIGFHEKAPLVSQHLRLEDQHARNQCFDDVQGRG